MLFEIHFSCIFERTFTNVLRMFISPNNILHGKSYVNVIARAFYL